MPDKSTNLISKTKITPEVRYDSSSNNIRIVGESSPENALDFYRPVFEWSKRSLDVNSFVVLEFDLRYFNTSTAKQFIALFDMLDTYYQKGCDVTVIWSRIRGDSDMEEAGEELLEGVYFPYKIVR